MKWALIIILACFVLCSLGLDPALADDDKHKVDTDEDESDDDKNEKKGDELTGYIAAVLFGMANVATAIGISARAMSRTARFGKTAKAIAVAVIRLRRCHYILNLSAAGVAMLHWFLSKCGVLSLQKWGMVMAVFIVITGVLVRYRIAPQPLQRRLFQIHTNLYVAMIVLTLVVFGHIMTD